MNTPTPPDAQAKAMLELSELAIAIAPDDMRQKIQMARETLREIVALDPAIMHIAMSMTSLENCIQKHAELDARNNEHTP